MEKLLKTRDYEDGFTLVELLVVILIIGILASIAIPAFLSQRSKAKEASLRSDMKTMATAMETYYVEHPPEALNNANNDGWATVALGKNGHFIGLPNLTTGYYENGLENIPLSDGNSIGVVTSVRNTRVLGSYCLVANAENTKYEFDDSPPSGTTSWHYALYYDSISGGIFEPEDLPTDGACFNYKMWMG